MWPPLPHFRVPIFAHTHTHLPTHHVQLSHYYRLLHVEGAARRHHCRLRAADPKSGVSLDDVRAKVGGWGPRGWGLNTSPN